MPSLTARMIAACAGALSLVAGCSRERSHEPIGETHVVKRYMRTVLPPQQKAFCHWTNAMALATLSRDDDDLRDAFLAASALKSNLAENVRHPLRRGKQHRDDGCLRSNMTTVAACPTLVRWLDAHADVYRQIDSGLALGRCQFPEVAISNAYEALHLTGFIDLQRYKMIEGRRKAEEGLFTEALDAFDDLREMSQMVAKGDGPLLSYATQITLREEGWLCGMWWLSQRVKTDGAALREILSRVPVPHETEDSLAQACHVEASLYSCDSMREFARQVAAEPQAFPIRFKKVAPHENLWVTVD